MRKIRQEQPKLCKYKLKIFIDEYSRKIGAKEISASNSRIDNKKAQYVLVEIRWECKSRGEGAERVRQT
jgi:hypothetical protein